MTDPECPHPGARPQACCTSFLHRGVEIIVSSRHVPSFANHLHDRWSLRLVSNTGIAANRRP